jgi:hypothetical protein
MKNFSLLILLAVSFILFLVGVSIPGRQKPIHIILVVLGVVLGFIFYLLTFYLIRKKASLGRGERMLWTVAIVILPMIGNMLYILIHDLSSSKQVPHPNL